LVREEKMKILFLTQMFVLILSITAYSYETNVHEQITKNSITASDIREYFVGKLGISIDKK